MAVPGRAIKRYRTAKGWSQRALGRRAGVTDAYITMLEGGKRTGTVAVLKRIARALGVSVAALVG